MPPRLKSYQQIEVRKRCERALLQYLTDLHDAGNIRVVSLVGDEFGSGGCKRALEMGQRAEEEMSHCVKGAGVPGGRPPMTRSISVRTSPLGASSFCEKRKMRAEIIVPVEMRAWGRRIHDAEPDHGEEDNTPGKKTT